MKKFIGNVNGKSFDNEKDFNEAAAKAIKENSDNLSITSYYKYEEDKTEPVEMLETPSNYVNKGDYALVDQKPVSLFGGKVLEYKISDELKKMLEGASNKKEISEHSTKIRDWASDTIETYTERVKELEVEIERLRDELYVKTSGLKELKARKKYYENILDIVGPVENETTDDTKEEVQETTDDFSKEFKDVYDSLSSFLKYIKFF